jgi:tRNA A-37 threonylcarbamoyl transferase component Bud32
MTSSKPTPLERLLAEQAACWRAGNRIPASELLARHPQLRQDASALAALARAEQALRRELGETASLPPSSYHSGPTAPRSEAPTSDREAGRWTNLPQIPGYTLRRLIKHGGMGAVYEAEQHGLGRTCAIKFLLAGKLANALDAARFRSEAAALGKLRHPGIVEVHGWGDHEGLLYLVMEYMPGGSLSDRLQAGPLPEVEAGELVRQLALAVQHAHEAGIIHRDLKPANVLLDSGGQGRVSDFGLARLVGEDGVTQTGETAGTPGYMAPEQARGGLKQAGPPADVWGLGAILYACLAGRAPFTGNRLEVLRRTCEEPPPPLPRGTSPGLEAVVLKCLEKSEGARYSSAQALADDLGRWLEGHKPSAQRAVWPRLTRWARKRPILLAATVLLALALALAPFLRPGPGTAPGTDAAAELASELALGKGAELFNARGEPRASPVLLGRGFTAPAHDGAFTVETQSLCLAMLAANPGMDHYRIEAEVRHDRTTSTGKVGLFAARRTYETVPEEFDSFVHFTFNDILDEGAVFEEVVRVAGVLPLPERPLNQARLWGTLRLSRVWKDDSNLLDAYICSPEVFKPGCREHGEWRPIALEVTPLEVRAFWGSPPVEVASLTAAEFADSLHERCQDLTRDHDAFWLFPTLATRGGFGLFVFNGAASFRNVRIRPVSPSP